MSIGEKYRAELRKMSQTEPVRARSAYQINQNRSLVEQPKLNIKEIVVGRAEGGEQSRMERKGVETSGKKRGESEWSNNIGAEWSRVNQSGSEWNRVDWSGAGWSGVERSEAK